MSLGTTAPEPQERRPFNIRDADTSTNQEAVAVPLFSGVAKLSLTWISELYNKTSKTVDSGGSAKGKAPTGGGQKKWYGDIVGIACYCPDDEPVGALYYVLINDEVAYSGALSRAPGTHYAAFTIPKFCQAARVYWGTKDSPLESLILTPRGAVPSDPGFDPRDPNTWPKNAAGGATQRASMTAGQPNPKSGHYDQHPAYRNQCRFEFKQLYLGSSPNVPNVQVVIARGAKFFGDRFHPTNPGVNPMGPLYEVLTDDLAGASVPVSRLNEQSFQDTADALTAADVLIAPAWRESKSIRGLLAEFFQYYDGFIRRGGATLEAGHFSHGDVDVDALVELGSDDFAKEPNIKPGDLAETKNTFVVEYTNPEKWWFEDFERFVDQANVDKVGEKRVDNLSRPFLADPAYSQRYATEWGTIHALEPAGGSALVMREKLQGLRQGDRFKGNVASVELAFVWRILAAETPSDRAGAVKLTLEKERGIYPELYIQPPAPKLPDFIIESTLIEEERIAELPSGLKTMAAVQVGIFAQRPSAHILGFHVHVSPDDEIYDKVATGVHFATLGQLAGAYSAATADLDTVTGVTLDLFGTDLESIVSQTDAQRDDNNLLLFVDGEVMSVGQITALGSGRYNMKARRALFGTTKAAHFSEADCWLVYRRELVALDHRLFVPGATVYFKLQPYTFGEDHDIDEIDPIAHTFADSSAVRSIFNLALTTSARVAAGRIESRIAATWEFALDQDIFAFEVAIKRSIDATWNFRTVNTPATDWEVAPATSYDVKVRPVNSHGEPGDWCAPVTIVSASISPFSVTGLELVGQGNDTECRERDFKFACRLNSPSATPWTGGAPSPGAQDPAFDYLLWQIFVGGAIVYQEPTTAPHFEFTESKNEIAARLAGATNKFGSQGEPITLNVYAVDSFRNVSAPAILTVRNSAPVAPSDLSARAANNRTILVAWTNGPETDLEEIWILRNSVDNPNTATVLAKVNSRNNTFVDSLPGIAATATLFYWVRARDTFGNLSPISVGANATTEPIAALVNDIDDFELDETKLSLQIVILRGAVWSNNSPSAGSIAVNDHEIIYGGQRYPIIGESSAFKYFYWNVGDNVYTTSETPLDLHSNRFFIAQNRGGVAVEAWHSFANLVVGFANIAALAVRDANIESLAVAKLLGGIILGQEIILRNDAGNIGVIRSYDFVPGASGWAFGMDADGNAFLEINSGGTGAQLDALAAGAAAGILASTKIAAGIIVVNGSTSFGTGYDPTGKIPAGGGAADVNANSTTINGGKITTNTVEAAHLKADTVLGKRIYIGVGGKLESTDYAPGGPGFHIGEDGIEISAGVFRDGVVIRSLAAPTFTNDYTGLPLVDRTYTDNDLVAFRAHGPAGKKIRFTNDGSEVTETSPYWPDYPTGAGDGVGPDNFLGFVVGGSGYSGVIRARAVSGPSGEVLGKEATLRLTHQPIDLLPLPAAPPPSIIASSGIRGTAGYKAKIAARLSGATIMISVDGGVTFAPYGTTDNYVTSAGLIPPTTNAGEIAMAVDDVLFAYEIKDGYAPSATDVFYNTAIDPTWTDPGWHGPPGTLPP